MQQMKMNDRLDPDLIRANLKTRRIGRKVLVYDRTSSTNDIAAEYARNPDNDGLVVFAEEQTAGRGRTGATWQGGREESLLFSLALVDSPISNELLSLTCAVAMAEAIGQIGGCQAGIKWPNDIILDSKKVAGILLESKNRRAEDGRQRTADRERKTDDRRQTMEDSAVLRPPSSVVPDPPSVVRPPSLVIRVIGIGINCHQTPESLPPDLRATATSLDLVSGTRCQRVTVAKRVLTSLDHWLRVAERNGHQVIDTWSRLSTQLGQRVTLSCNKRRYTGNCIGVDPEKGLILQLDRGGVRIFDAAHTHIVK
ncbi:MAG: biotin--[acetyl-CoA-carboxylase] ligase [Planctomycetes bacterium]|nr:biotin--[acetyl-CoA-carboxylase] ligase [Planctomycetota bacterium]